MRYIVLIAVILLAPNIAFSFNCPFCSGSKAGYRDEQVYCQECKVRISPDNLFQQNGRQFVAGEAMEVMKGGYSGPYDRDNRIAPFLAGWNQFSPMTIISAQDLNCIMLFLHQQYPGFDRDLELTVVNSAISLAQLLIFSVPALSQLDRAEQKIALWWLTGYWLLRLSSVRQHARNFLAGTPAFLQDNAVQQQIGNIQGSAENLGTLSDVLKLFYSEASLGQPLTFSTGQSFLSTLTDNTPYIAQAVASGLGVVAVIKKSGTYFIISPYNQLFSTTKIKEALQILSRIASPWILLTKVIAALYTTSYCSLLGAALGAVTGIPILFFGHSLFGVSDRGAQLCYGAWIAMAMATYNIGFNPLWDQYMIHDDLPEQDETDEAD